MAREWGYRWFDGISRRFDCVCYIPRISLRSQWFLSTCGSRLLLYKPDWQWDKPIFICITFEHFGDFFPPIEYWTEPCGHVPLLGTRPCPHVDIWIKQGSNITNVGHYLRSDQYQHVDNICKSKNKWEIKMKMFFLWILEAWNERGIKTFAWLLEENHL